MKTFRYLILSLASLAVLTACEDDNYDGPKETFTGSFTDKETGEPFQTANGNTGIRIRMMEYSYSDNPQPYDMYAVQDGTFKNTKVFKGDYGVTPEGAFVPLEEEIIRIKGTVKKDYQVEPLLRVEWVGEPVLNADGTVDVQVRITRGTSNPDYQQDLAEAWLFVSETSYVGDYSYSQNYSTKLVASDLAGQLGQVITVRSGQPDGLSAIQRPFPEYSRKYFLRFGARTTRQFSGVNRYNYTTIKEITTVAR